MHALIKGDIAAFIHDAPIIWTLAAQHEADGLIALSPPLTTERLAWAFPRGERAMRDEANAALADWTKTGRLQRMVETWLPTIGR